MITALAQALKEVNRYNRDDSFVLYRERHLRYYGLVVTIVATLLIVGLHIQEYLTEGMDAAVLLNVRIVGGLCSISLTAGLLLTRKPLFTKFLVFAAFYIAAVYCAYLTHYSGGIESSYWFRMNLLLLFWTLFIPLSYRTIIIHSFIYMAIFWVVVWANSNYSFFAARVLEINSLLCGTILIGTVKSLSTNIVTQKIYLKHFSIENEIKRSDSLLYNTFPKKIANRLKNGERNIVNSFDDVSVMFANLSGFTKLTRERQPSQVVTLLDTFFTDLDELCETHGLEKIKTIGDSYMVIGGGPLPSKDHLERCITFGQDVLQNVESLNREFKTDLGIRIGIDTGSAIAGIIGTHKYTYDFWGITINTASRMESHGVRNRIQVTETVVNKTKDIFSYSPRGYIPIKNRESMKAWLLEPTLPS
ncbi:MAG: adenylate/guanylate cyclase domain-containing protein [Fibrobacterales bacterium]